MFTIKYFIWYNTLMVEYFVENALKYGVNISKKEEIQFDFLFNRLISENQKYNLTTITEIDDVYLLHFLDSITSIPFIKENANLCDIGSGCGFPALPLKIVRDDITLTMIDSVNKKVNYLNDTISLLKFSNAVAIHSRIEDFANSKNRENFDVVTSRAVAKLPTLLEYALPLVKIGGIFIAYKGDFKEELELSKNALNILGGKLVNTVNIPLSNNINHSLLIFEKVKNTPSLYPRGKNKERTNPIL